MWVYISGVHCTSVPAVFELCRKVLMMRLAGCLVWDAGCCVHLAYSSLAYLMLLWEGRHSIPHSFRGCRCWKHFRCAPCLEHMRQYWVRVRLFSECFF